MYAIECYLLNHKSKIQVEDNKNVCLLTNSTKHKIFVEFFRCCLRNTFKINLSYEPSDKIAFLPPSLNITVVEFVTPKGASNACSLLIIS